MALFPLLLGVLAFPGFACVPSATRSEATFGRRGRGAIGLFLLLMSAGCAAPRGPAGEPSGEPAGEPAGESTGATEPSSSHAMQPGANASGATGGAPGEARAAPPPSDEAPAGSSEVAEPPRPFQACQEAAECTAREEGCCGPCNIGGYVPMRVDHAKTLAEKCRREPFACPACLVPMPPQVTCSAGVCAFQ